MGLWLPIAINAHSAIVGGERYWWLSDDAMISMRYARNLASGFGLVWNPGERVEGYTNLLWTLYMALAHLLPIPQSKVSIVILLTNIIIGAASMPLAARLVRQLGGNRIAVAASLACCAFSTSVVYWAMSGLETALLTLLLLLVLCRLMDEADEGRPSFLTYLMAALLPIVRSDAVVLTMLLYAFSLSINPRKKDVVVYSLASLSLPLTHEAFRLYYYGDLLPNTAYLKVMNWDGRYWPGLRYAWDFLKHYPLLISSSVACSIYTRKRRAGLLMLALLIYTAYVIYIGGDVFPEHRFFVPVLPIIAAVSFTGLQDALVRRSLFAAAVLLCVLTLPLLFYVYPLAIKVSPRETGNLNIGLYLKENTPPDCKIGVFWAGTVSYFSGRYAVDMLGKSDRHVAYMAVAPGMGTRQGHNKFDYDYSLGVRKPDFLVAPFRLPVSEKELQAMIAGDSTYAARLYYNAMFREHYLPHPVNVNTWRTIFVSDWFLKANQKGG